MVGKIRALTMGDLQTWLNFAHDISDKIVEKLVPDISIFFEGFDTYMEIKIKQNEAYMAVDEFSERCMGVIAFSKKHNRITFFGVSELSDFEVLGSKLIELALEQLDCSRDITANVLKGDFEQLFKEKKLYEKYRFIEYDSTIFEAGVPAYIMKRSPHKT